MLSLDIFYAIVLITMIIVLSFALGMLVISLVWQKIVSQRDVDIEALEESLRKYRIKEYLLMFRVGLPVVEIMGIIKELSEIMEPIVPDLMERVDEICASPENIENTEGLFAAISAYLSNVTHEFVEIKYV